MWWNSITVAEDFHELSFVVVVGCAGVAVGVLCFGEDDEAMGETEAVVE